jgi:hypothetical protein
MLEEAAAKDLQRLLYTVSKLFSNPAPLLDGFLIIGFQKTLGRVFASTGETRAMAKPVKQNILVVSVAFENAFEIEIEIGGTRCKRSVPQDPQVEAVGDDSPKVPLVAIKVLLHQGVSAQPAMAGWWSAVEVHAEPLHVNRRVFLILPGTVGNGIYLAFH